MVTSHRDVWVKKRKQNNKKHHIKEEKVKEYYARTCANGKSESYVEHVRNVLKKASDDFDKIVKYAPNLKRFKPELLLAAYFHDVGKLSDDNQKVLSGEKKSKNLPTPHSQVGGCFLFGKKKWIGSSLICCHHSDLKNIAKSAFDKTNPEENNRLIDLHNHLFDGDVAPMAEEWVESQINALKGYNHQEFVDAALNWRLAMSCLVDADHSDAARFDLETKIGKCNLTRPIELRPTERKAALKKYVNSLYVPSKANDERKKLFDKCHDESIGEEHIEYCDAPVGTGKTTALMARALSVAEKRELHHVIVVLPYTNIITQSVKVYREVLTLPGEDPKKVVAELHHLADVNAKGGNEAQWDGIESQWDAPIIVTTAVAFFESLASDRTSKLRKLHELPGSVIILDEAHAMLPSHLLPLAWRWMALLAEYCDCHWILGSGSLIRFWEYLELNEKYGLKLPQIGNSLSEVVNDWEVGRINYLMRPEISLLEAVDWLLTLEGPVIVVVNTVVTAANLADELQNRIGLEKVVHLSNALTPIDRAKTVARIKEKLKSEDKQWFLIATSCVEAGMDFSFRTGVRECCSIVSLLQLAGRVNRSHEYDCSDVWTIKLKNEQSTVTSNPCQKHSSQILENVFNKGETPCAELCTELAKKELRESIGDDKFEEFLEKEKGLSFNWIAQNFKVIDDLTVPVVIDKEVIDKIENYDMIDWREVQMHSVTVYGNKTNKYSLKESSRFEGLYYWTLDYDSNLGYMKGVLDMKGDGKFV